MLQNKINANYFTELLIPIHDKQVDLRYSNHIVIIIGGVIKFFIGATQKSLSLTLGGPFVYFFDMPLPPPPLPLVSMLLHVFKLPLY